MKPISLNISNFLSVRNSEVYISPGMWLVRGKIGGYSLSNGAGKSTLIESLVWVLFDKTTRGIRADDVIRGEEKKCTVEFKFSDGEDEHTIVRERARSSGSKVSLDGKKITQQELEKYIRIDYNTFTAAIVHPQDWGGFAEMNDKDRKSIFSNLLGLDKFEVYKLSAKQFSSDNLGDISKAEELIRSDERVIEVIKGDIVSMTKSAEEYDTKRKEFLSGLKDHISYLIDKKSKAESNNKKIEKFKGELVKLYDEQKLINKEFNDEQELEKEKRYEIKEIINSIKSAQSAIDGYEADINNLPKDGANCDKCGQKITRKYYDEYVKGRNDKIDSIRNDIKRLNKVANDKADDLEDIVSDIKELDDLLLKIQSDIDKVTSILSTLDYVDVEDIDRDISSTKSNIERHKDKENPHLKLIKEKKESLEKLNEDVLNREKERKELLEMQSYYDFWVEGFGPRGMPSAIYDSLVPIFEDKANKYIQKLTDGSISIEMSTQKENKSGTVSDRFTILVKDGDGVRPYESYSGGEKKRVGVAIDMALSDLVSIVSQSDWDFSVFDECFDSLDTSGKQSVYELLDDMTCGTVWVVSHDSEISDLFSNHITAEKIDGVTEYV